MKRLTAWLVLITLSTVPFSNSLRADSPGQNTETTQEVTQETEIITPQPTGTVQPTDSQESADDYEEPQGAEVAPSSNSSSNNRKKEIIRNCLIAGAAVIVAVVSMLIVSNNNGSHK